MKDRQGNVREFRAPGVTDDQITKGSAGAWTASIATTGRATRSPASPQRAVDDAIARGEIPRALPFARRKRSRPLKVDYPTRAAAEQQIGERLRGFYGQNYAALVPAHGAEIDQLVRAAQRLYGRNVFPADEGNVGHARKQPGAHRRAGLLPLPRRPAQDGRRTRHQAGLRSLPRYQQ